MSTAVIGSIVKSHVSQLIGGLIWFGAPIIANASWTEGLAEQGGIGLGFLERSWIETFPNLSISIETVLGESSVLSVNNVAWNLNDYILALLNVQGYAIPAENTALLNNISLSFNAGDAVRGSFNSVIFRPTNALTDWFDTYSSALDVPTGTGDQLNPTSSEDVVIIVPDDPITLATGIDGIKSITAQVSIDWTPIESTDRRVGFLPRLPIGVELSFELYHDYFTNAQSLFRRSTILSDINIWKFRCVAPKIMSVNQNNQSTGMRTWNVNLRAKNLIKEV